MSPHAGRPLCFLLIVLLSACSEPAVEQIPVHVPKNVTVPPDMVYIPAGEFIMGSPGDRRTRGGKTVRLGAYLIDRYETTREQYHAFRSDYAFSPQTAHYPVSHVTYHDAEAYCRSKGRRLPTEAEWEKAARGADGRKWPWRIFFRHPNDGFSGFIPEPVDKRDGWVSPYGVYGMGYNVWEWVADWYDYDGMPAERRETLKVIRGGLIQTHLNIKTSPTWFRNYMDPDQEFNFIGFRCAGDVNRAG
ncbi:MAG: formylglycine-generating enzyme family protein [Nitrospinales bacterium]